MLAAWPILSSVPSSHLPLSPSCLPLWQKGTLVGLRRLVLLHIESPAQSLVLVCSVRGCFAYDRSSSWDTQIYSRNLSETYFPAQYDRSAGVLVMKQVPSNLGRMGNFSVFNSATHLAESLTGFGTMCWTEWARPLSYHLSEQILFVVRCA